MLTAMFLKSLLVSLTIPALIGAAPTLPPDVHEDIVGGTPAKTDEFPFIVSIQNNGIHFCGGILVNPDTVVTAAHCTFNQDVSKIKVRAGSMKTATGGVLVAVNKFVMTPGSKPENKRDDIAIIKLHTSVRLSPSVAYATLARKDYKPRAGTVLTAAGWGSINATHVTYPGGLHKVDIPVVDLSKCQKKYGENRKKHGKNRKKHGKNGKKHSKERIAKSKFCAMAPGGSKDICQGDSGGPMVDSHNTVVGIISSDRRCTSKNHASTYANIGSFRDFIKKHE